MQDPQSLPMKPIDQPVAYPGQGRTEQRGAPDDVALIDRMRAGDEQALGLLYDRLQDVVRSTALRIIGAQMEAEDIVEDVFWQVWKQADRFDAARGGVLAWILTITRSRSLDHLRAS